jgi:hypothetical protein
VGLPGFKPVDVELMDMEETSQAGAKSGEGEFYQVDKRQERQGFRITAV